MQPPGPPGVFSGAIHKHTAAGLTMTLDASWLAGPGYRLVRVTLVPTVPPTADRTLTLEFTAGDPYSGRINALTVAEQIEIPAGSGPIQKTISVPPSNCIGGYYRYQVIEGGREVKGLSNPDWVTFNMVMTVDDALPRILFIQAPTAKVPATTAMSEILPLNTFTQYRPIPTATTTPGGTIVRELPTAIVRAPGDLTSRWIDYTAHDIIALSLDQLVELEQKEPEKFQAIVAWTRAGGNLLVYGVGGDWERLGHLETLLGLAQPKEEKDPLARGWREPDKSRFGRPVPGLPIDETQIQGSVNRQFMGSRVGVQTVPTPETLLPGMNQVPPPPAKPHFLVREFGFGLIVALAPADPFPGKKEDWAWVFAEIGTDRLVWSQRHGLSMVGENPDFWRFQIPGVGLAPVGSFGVLITAFVLAIGPLNYWLLRRWKRLHLMIVTVPLAAGAVTLALFAYAVIADGLGTRVRVRSVTLVDQARGRAACWSRLSYYCGLAPRGGLRFPEDVAVYPWEPLPGDFGSANREVLWQDDQWLSQGWLSSRTPTQFLTVRSRPSRIGLEVVAQPSGAVSVRNRLGTGIKLLLLRTEDGKFYQAEAVEPGADAELQATDATALSRFAAIDRDNAPQLPPGMDPAMMNNLYLSRRYRGSAISFLSTWQKSSRMEQTLQQEAMGRGPTSAGIWGFAPRSYIALVEHSPETVLGNSAAQEEASYHVIFGTW